MSNKPIKKIAIISIYLSIFLLSFILIQASPGPYGLEVSDDWNYISNIDSQVKTASDIPQSFIDIYADPEADHYINPNRTNKDPILEEYCNSLTNYFFLKAETDGRVSQESLCCPAQAVAGFLTGGTACCSSKSGYDIYLFTQKKTGSQACCAPPDRSIGTPPGENWFRGAICEITDEGTVFTTKKDKGIIRTKKDVCGNGIKEKGEACDDGNKIDDDGCTNKCKKKDDGFSPIYYIIPPIIGIIIWYLLKRRKKKKKAQITPHSKYILAPLFITLYNLNQYQINLFAEFKIIQLNIVKLEKDLEMAKSENLALVKYKGALVKYKGKEEI